jgi:hypothetical protein
MAATVGAPSQGQTETEGRSPTEEAHAAYRDWMSDICKSGDDYPIREYL